MTERIKLFLQESRRELLRVNWPTRQETVKHTTIIIGISLAAAVFLGALDFLFNYAIEWILL